MVTIKRGKKVLTVSQGAFINYFRAKGFVEVESTQAHENAEVVNTHGDPGTEHSGDSTQQDSDSEETYAGGYDEEEAEMDLSEIPLGEMTMGQLYEYAEQLNVPTDGMHNRKELRAAIKAHLKA